jgi:hypothetical protein
MGLGSWKTLFRIPDLRPGVQKAPDHYGMSMVLVAEGPGGVGGPNRGKSVLITYISSPVKTITLMGLK